MHGVCGVCIFVFWAIRAVWVVGLWIARTDPRGSFIGRAGCLPRQWAIIKSCPLFGVALGEVAVKQIIEPARAGAVLSLGLSSCVKSGF